MPIVISGFEPLDILQGTLITIRQLATERSEVENQYSRILDRDANKAAQKLVFQVFQIGDRKWRCIGICTVFRHRLEPAQGSTARQGAVAGAGRPVRPSSPTPPRE
jgi:hydrogenase expression/formation protein HypD